MPRVSDFRSVKGLREIWGVMSPRERRGLACPGLGLPKMHPRQLPGNDETPPTRKGQGVSRSEPEGVPTTRRSCSFVRTTCEL